MLRRHGVLPAKATKLVASFGANVVSETVEYLAEQVIAGGRKNIDNPAGLIIHSLENSLPVPAGFVSSRKRKSIDDAHQNRRAKEQRLLQQQLAYSSWLDEQQDRAVRDRYNEHELESKLLELVKRMVKQDVMFKRMPEKGRRDVCYRLLRKELASEVQLPSFEEWQVTTEQARLF